MATSRSDSTDSDSALATVDPAPSEEEAAAILAALAAERDRLDSADGRRSRHGDGWEGRRWSFVGRLERLGRDSRRPPVGAPRDGWSALGRSDRF